MQPAWYHEARNMDVRTKNMDVSKVVFHPLASGEGKDFFTKPAILNKEVNCIHPSLSVKSSLTILSTDQAKLQQSFLFILSSLFSFNATAL
jgi:hypothetical protein